jgi:Fic-DOC domain mobile mystery protein B
MFGDVWSWAGKYRTTEKTIGVPPWTIRQEMRTFLENARYWIDHGVYPPDELAVRFHHRLVYIHPFPNGNGRVARLAADVLATELGSERFTWGRADLISAGAARARYIEALRAADSEEYGPLIAFARS